MNLIRKITNSNSSPDEEFVLAMKKILRYRPRKVEFYKEAFTHSSLKELNSDGFPMNYERLEFLGDAVLGSVIANYLFKKIPTGDEGYLTQMRSKIVSREHLNELGKDLDLIKFVRSAIPSSNFGENIHGNLFEALIGAIHSDRGYSFTRKFIKPESDNCQIQAFFWKFIDTFSALTPLIILLLFSFSKRNVCTNSYACWNG